MITEAVLVLVALGFSWSMGAHYTGACMGMPYAAGSIKLRPALTLMAAMTLFGATFFSHHVLIHVGHGIVLTPLRVYAAISVIGIASLLTILFTRLRIPTSTIQIMVFALIGTAIPLGLRVEWTAVLRLAIIWLLAPFVACGLGFLFTKILDLIPWMRSTDSVSHVGPALVTAGAIASVAMGANDVSNATAVFLSTRLSGPLMAGFIGGTGLALGVVTWGRPLLERVAFEVVRLDRIMATAAQLVQALVVLTAVIFGYFTSMNQALVGAMAGAGLARGRKTIESRTVFMIVQGWFIGPGAGFAVAYLVASVYLK